jgi:O-antigen ligase
MSRPEASGAGRSSPLTRSAELVATYGPAAFILSLPLEFTSLYLHQQLSRFVLALMAGAGAYLVMARRRALTIPRSPSVLLLVLYVLASIAGWLMTRAPGSTASLLDIVLYPFVALILANMVLGEQDHRRAWNAFLVSALVIAALGVLLYATNTSIWAPNRAVATRLNITFGDPNITARFLTLGAAVAVLMFSARQAPGWLCVAAAVACGVVLPLTLSRSGLGLFVLTAVFAVVIAFRRKRAAALAAIAILAFVIATGVNPTTRQRAEDAGATVVSAVTGKPVSLGDSRAAGAYDRNAAEDNRVYLVRAGLQMFRDHPVAGVGFGGYQHALLTKYRPFLPSNVNAAGLDTLSHASLVTVMAEQGLIGSFLFLGFLVALGVEAWRGRRRGDSWALWVAIPAALVVPIFVYSQIEGRFIQEPYLWLSIGLLYSARLRQREAAAQAEAAPAVRARQERVA